MTSAGESETWLKLRTTRVIELFLETLARSHKWNRIYLISPWISPLDIPGVMSFDALLKRLRDDSPSLYIVTRPPDQPWHKLAIEQLAATKVANIKLLSTLHTKLYYADTAQGMFAMLGSANLTKQSLSNREIGVLIRGSGPGIKIVRDLSYEASEIYRSDGSKPHSIKQL